MAPASRRHRFVGTITGLGSTSGIRVVVDWWRESSYGAFADIMLAEAAGGRPCVDAAHSDQVMEFEPGVLDEERWRLFAEATAERAVRSTLTLPVFGGGEVVATVNLYAASARAFVGHPSELASIFGA